MGSVVQKGLYFFWQDTNFLEFGSADFIHHICEVVVTKEDNTKTECNIIFLPSVWYVTVVFMVWMPGDPGASEIKVIFTNSMSYVTLVPENIPEIRDRITISQCFFQLKSSRMEVGVTAILR